MISVGAGPPGTLWAPSFSRVASSVALLTAYLVVFLPLHAVIDESVTALSVAPVALIAWHYGMRSGLAAGIIALPTNTLLLNLAGQPGWTAAVTGSGALASAALAMVGAGVGMLRELRRQLKLESQERMRAEETALQDARARHALDEQNQHLQQVDEARSRLMSAVSHELKTPVATILMFADIIEGGLDSQANQRQVQQLRVLRRNAALLTRLVDDLSDVSRIEAGTFSIVAEDCDVRPLFDEVAENLGSVFESKRQTLYLVAPDDQIWMSADRQRLLQVLTNVLTNASKYSPPGSSIEVRSRVEDGWLYVEVADHGIGIPEPDLERLFTPFFRADNSGEYPGTGLGLAITKSIIERHGGEITVQSEPGSGVTVSFQIPGVIEQSGSAGLLAA